MYSTFQMKLLERLYGSTWHLGKEIQELKRRSENLEEWLKSNEMFFQLSMSSSVHTTSGICELAAPCRWQHWASINSSAEDMDQTVIKMVLEKFVTVIILDMLPYRTRE